MNKKYKDFTIDIIQPPIEVLGRFEPLPTYDPNRKVMIDGKEVEGIPGKLLLALIDLRGPYAFKEVFEHMKDNGFLEE